MSDSIASLGAVTDSTYGQGQQPKPPAEAADNAAADPESADLLDPADLRLIIEDDQSDGSLVYKTVDGRTGAVVRKLPREQVLRMSEAQTYVAGQLIKTRA